MRYSLANYICNIKPNDASILDMFGIVNVGGEGSTTDSITASRADDLFSTTSYKTGGYVHNKNLSKVGSISITLNQLAENISKLKRMINVYHSADYSGLTITLTDSDGKVICTGVDCVPTKIPDQVFGSDAATQTWSFTCGEINFE